MHTLSGRRFDLGDKFTPSVKDIGVGLSRIPRWAGATVRPWSVLQHALASYNVAAQEVPNDPEVQLAVLMHDMEEMATSDIPKPFKHPEQEKLAEDIRQWMYDGTLHVPYPGADVLDIVHAIDSRMASAEASCLCHPLVRADFGIPDLVSVDAVWELLDVGPNRAIRMFERAAQRLLATPKMKHLARRLR